MKISREIGNKAEDRAVEYLIKEGYSIIERNFYSRFGEIDIVCKKEDILYFIEVKYSKNTNPIYRITPQKLSKIIKTIEYFFYTTKIDLDYQINALLVQDTNILMIENISN